MNYKSDLHMLSLRDILLGNGFVFLHFDGYEGFAEDWWGGSFPLNLLPQSAKPPHFDLWTAWFSTSGLGAMQTGAKCPKGQKQMHLGSDGGSPIPPSDLGSVLPEAGPPTSPLTSSSDGNK